MPILTAKEPAPPRPVIVSLYGEPGTGKTSLCNTCKNPILLDFDRGYDRSVGRKDVFIVENWPEVRDWIKAGGHKAYSTVIIDTTKACLDDYLAAYVRSADTKNEKAGGGLSLSGYGAMGDEFKQALVEPLRLSGVDLVLVSHAKVEDEGDTKRHVPDVTGGSSSLIARIADQIGYVKIQGGVRVITWNPTDRTIGKNTAQLQPTEVPAIGTEAFASFGERLINDVKTAIQNRTEQQREAEELYAQLQADLAEADGAPSLTLLALHCKELPKYLAAPMAQAIGAKAKEHGLVWNKEASAYEPADDAAAPPAAAKKTAAKKTAKADKEEA